MFMPSKKPLVDPKVDLLAMTFGFQLKVVLALLEAHPEIMAREDIASDLQMLRAGAEVHVATRAGSD